MTITAPVATPKTYTELFERYFPYVKSLVSKAGVHDEQVEDVAMTLIMKFFEKGVLEQYDPEHEGHKGRKVQFTTFLSGFIVAYVYHYVQQTRKHADRERLYIDGSLTEDGLDWLDYRGYVHTDDTSQVEYDMTVARIRSHLRTIPTKNKRNFLLLFDLIVLQLEEGNRTNIRELAGMFEVSEALVSGWMKMLRSHISQVTL